MAPTLQNQHPHCSTAEVYNLPVAPAIRALFIDGAPDDDDAEEVCAGCAAAVAFVGRGIEDMLVAPSEPLKVAGLRVGMLDMVKIGGPVGLRFPVEVSMSRLDMGEMDSEGLLVCSPKGVAAAAAGDPGVPWFLGRALELPLSELSLDWLAAELEEAVVVVVVDNSELLVVDVVVVGEESLLESSKL